MHEPLDIGDVRLLKELLDIYPAPVLIVLPTNLTKILSAYDIASPAPFFSQSTASGVCGLCLFDSVLEWWWVLVRGWSQDKRGRLGGKGSDGEFFVRPHSFHSSSAVFSPVTHEPRI